MNAIVEDIQNTKLELARKFAEELVGDYDTARLILTLANQAGVLAVERDGLAADIRQMSDNLVTIEGLRHIKDARMYAEMHKLMSAAKLALEALDEAQKYAYNIGKYLHGVPQAITALRQAGVQ